MARRAWLAWMGIVWLAGAAWAGAGKKAPVVSAEKRMEAAGGVDEPAAGGAVTIVKSQLCTAVSDRNPADGKDSPAEFEAKVDRVYFWNEADVKDAPKNIKHVWWLDGEKVAEVPLTLKYSHVRTWSSKKIGVGSWKVEAQDDAGAALATAEFTVK